MFEFFYDEHRGAASDNKTVAFFIEGARHCLGIGACRESARADKRQNGEKVHILGAGDEDDVLATDPNAIERVAEGVRG